MPSVTDLKVWPTKGNKTVLANGSCVFDNCLQVKFSIINGPKGPFVGFPGKSVEKDGKKTFYADVAIVNDEVKTEFTRAVMSEYNKRMGNTLNQGASPEPAPQTAPSDLPF
jgi:DNA-binding cell septation regulator SpoVG